jgi:copper chaperone CopZ
MKNLLTLILVFLTLTVSAQEKSKSKKISFEVSGVCDMCKSRIEKAAFKTKGVKSAQWSPETKQLDLVINEFKTTPLKVKNNLAAVGHDTAEVQSNKGNYEALHGCCKYEREFVKKKIAKESCCASNKKNNASCSTK